MKIISLNIRGLNHPHKHDILFNLVRDHKPEIYLIQETKMPFGRLEKMKLVVFKDCGVHCSDVDDMPGGIASFWNPRLI